MTDVLSDTRILMRQEIEQLRYEFFKFSLRRILLHDDANTEFQAGLNLAFAKTWRLQLELSQSLAEGTSSSAIESTVFRIQLGARFKE